MEYIIIDQGIERGRNWDRKIQGEGKGREGQERGYKEEQLTLRELEASYGNLLQWTLLQMHK